MPASLIKGKERHISSHAGLLLQAIVHLPEFRIAMAAAL